MSVRSMSVPRKNVTDLPSEVLDEKIVYYNSILDCSDRQRLCLSNKEIFADVCSSLRHRMRCSIEERMRVHCFRHYASLVYFEDSFAHSMISEVIQEFSENIGDRETLLQAYVDETMVAISSRMKILERQNSSSVCPIFRGIIKMFEEPTEGEVHHLYHLLTDSQKLSIIRAFFESLSDYIMEFQDIVSMNAWWFEEHSHTVYTMDRYPYEPRFFPDQVHLTFQDVSRLPTQVLPFVVDLRKTVHNKTMQLMKNILLARSNELCTIGAPSDDTQSNDSNFVGVMHVLSNVMRADADDGFNMHLFFKGITDNIKACDDMRPGSPKHSMVKLFFDTLDGRIQDFKNVVHMDRYFYHRVRPMFQDVKNLPVQVLPFIINTMQIMHEHALKLMSLGTPPL